MALARVHGSEAGASFEILARYESEDTRSHAEVMGPYAQAALQDAGVRGEDLDAILTGTGPGTFYGPSRRYRYCARSGFCLVGAGVRHDEPDRAG